MTVLHWDTNPHTPDSISSRHRLCVSHVTTYFFCLKSRFLCGVLQQEAYPRPAYSKRTLVSVANLYNLLSGNLCNFQSPTKRNARELKHPSSAVRETSPRMRKGRLLITHALPGHYHAELREAEAPPEDHGMQRTYNRLDARTPVPTPTPLVGNVHALKRG